MVFPRVVPRVVGGCHISDSIRVHAYGLLLISLWEKDGCIRAHEPFCVEPLLATLVQGPSKCRNIISDSAEGFRDAPRTLGRAASL